MAAVASITIVVDEKGAVTALNNIKSQVESLGPSIENFGQTNQRVFGGMSNDHRSALESMRLVTEEAGVRLPRALLSLVAQSEMAGAAVSAAFNVFAIVGFIQIAGMAVSRIEDVAKGLDNWVFGTDEVNKSNDELSKTLAKQRTEIEASLKAYELIGLTGSARAVEQSQQIQNDITNHVRWRNALQLDLDALNKRKAVLDAVAEAQQKAVEPGGAAALNPAAYRFFPKAWK